MFVWMPLAVSAHHPALKPAVLSLKLGCFSRPEPGGGLVLCLLVFVGALVLSACGGKPTESGYQN